MKDVHETAPGPPPTNRDIARALEEAADLLEVRDQDNPFRSRAFRRAAETVLQSGESIADLVLNVGPAALKRLPGIGDSLAEVIHRYVLSGGGKLRYRDLGEVAPTSLLTALPGIGDVLARRILDELHVQDLESLETAIYEGRLERIAGFGARRVAALRQMINSMLGRRLQRRARDLGEQYHLTLPPVDLILKVDAEYRRRAEEGSLRKITPRRFNPDRLAWLPVLSTREGGWKFRALFSNTAQAHSLGKTRDWVIIFFERGGESHQCTVVTETRGPRAGRRVVRGRESESEP
jgi:DNA polymerase (family 10)